ncbi:hypothetical protein B0A49_04684 [Cryomyces minteri]|uniref:alpha-1,2-Mannosidase n=1 Tax=Cryomyces minteri TaxID=331657 RepID=A0A4V5NEA5_9PEZI|nr:hypothetical protein B0A49_04684 [Cryomyces minteri]
MSFSIPRNVPSFDNPQRQYENTAWGSSGRSRFPDSGNGYANGASEKISGMFGTKGGLPMYKDKPYNYFASRRKAWFQRKRVLAGIGLLLLGLVYWLGILSPAGDVSKTSGKGEKSTWNMFSRPQSRIDWDERREKVKSAFTLSWGAYEKYAWGYDEYHPISKDGRQMVPNGMGWIIVDALDTLMLMNLTTQINHARQWISTNLTYDQNHDVNTFETTIRMLGGLLSAHYLSTTFPDMAPIPGIQGSSGEDLYLEKASDLADRLMGAYDSESGVPYASVNLHTGKGIVSHQDGGASSTAEATSLQLEMKYLAKLTGEKNYWDKAEKVMQVVDDNAMEDGLLPIFIYADRGTFRDNNIRLGSRGDSYYEYLIKQYLQTSEQEPIYSEMWDQALAGVRKHLITYSQPSNLTVLGERPMGLQGALAPKMDHLVCFMPGTIALGATGGRTVTEAKLEASWSKQQEEEMDLAKQLMKTCWGMYLDTPTGLAPEITHFEIYDPPKMMYDGVLQSPDVLSHSADAEWRKDYVVKPADAHNLQRPETVESLFYMWRITGDEVYREWGWEMFQSFMKHTAADGDAGFTSIDDVTVIPTSKRDNMESFWLAETLKYFYLLFGPTDILPLTDIVLNTEAHPFPRFELGKLFSTGWQRRPRDKSGKVLPVAREAPGNEGGDGKADPQVKVETVQVVATPATVGGKSTLVPKADVTGAA